jgi:hypothetical protein
MTVVQGINLLACFAALLFLSGAGYLTVFGPAQLDALALLSTDEYIQNDRKNRGSDVPRGVRQPTDVPSNS